MPIPLYLAMTGAEFSSSTALPRHVAWMACHFSAYSTGLSNFPPRLPPGSLLILNDRTPACGHDPAQIAEELAQLASDLSCAGILLDLEHPPQALTQRIVHAICEKAPCPVAVTPDYMQDDACAVFLTPPMHIPLTDFLVPWEGREIWLEAAIEDVEFCITETGCRIQPLPCPPEAFPHRAPGAFSHYHISVEEDAVRFSFRRNRTNLEHLANEAKSIRYLVGLFQQLKPQKTTTHRNNLENS